MAEFHPDKGSLGWWRSILKNREERMERLKEESAPDIILSNEQELIDQANREIEKFCEECEEKPCQCCLVCKGPCRGH